MPSKRVGRRPEGTDGSDFQYRMVVEDRYKKLADTKMQMRKLLTVQTMYILIRGAWVAFQVFGGEDYDQAIVAMIAIGAAAAWVGTISLKGTKPWSQRLYFAFTAATIVLALWPMLKGDTLTTLRDLYAEADFTQDYTRVCLALLEVGQDFLGIATEIVALFVMSNIMSLQDREKQSTLNKFMEEDEKDS